MKPIINVSLAGWYIIFLELGRGAPYYFLDTNGLDVSKEELDLNIYEQIYGDKLK